jgi:hypothetical protein
VTIATALFTALVGMVGTFATAKLSYDSGARQIAGENERSATEFLRKQRQEAYTAFGSEASATYAALVTTNDMFQPALPPPTFEDFNGVDHDLASHMEKVATAALTLELVASDDVCNAGVREFHALANASDRRHAAAWPYVTGQKPQDDAYGKAWMTDKDIQALADLMVAYTRAAREDLSDPALRKPGRNCPRA